MAGLTLKQQRFADEYIISGNATQVAIATGYSPKYVNTNASKLLQNTTLQYYLKGRNKELESQKIADMREVKEFWTNTLRDEENEIKDRLKASEYIAKTKRMQRNREQRVATL